MIKRIVRYALLGVFLSALGLVGWWWTAPAATAFAGGTPVALAQYKGADPTGVPVAMRSASLAVRGEYLARAADCVACHTALGGRPFAGGHPIALPMGTIYSTNLTPHATGIAGYSDKQWIAMMRHGKRRDGAQLYPAMPFTTYALMTDADALAIKAYLMTLAPVNAPTLPNTLSWPFSQRTLVSLWGGMFNRGRPFEPVAERSGQWNRGAYLVEAAAHCGECHTPRNLALGVDQRRKFAGAVTAGWRAPNISSDQSAGVGGWTDAALTSYLTKGYASGHGVATGPMGEAVDMALSHLAAEDIAAMVAFLRAVPAQAGQARRTAPAPVAFNEGGGASGRDRLGEKVFASACAACHDWTGVSPVTPFATLTGVRAVNDVGGSNVVQVVLFGVNRPHMPVMPAFGASYSDREIAAVTNYVTARFGSKGAFIDADYVAKLRRQPGR